MKNDNFSKKANKSTLFFENLNMIVVKALTKSGHFYVEKGLLFKNSDKSTFLFRDFNGKRVFSSGEFQYDRYKVAKKSGCLHVESWLFFQKSGQTNVFLRDFQYDRCKVVKKSGCLNV